MNEDNGNLNAVAASPDGKVVACYNSASAGGPERHRLSLWDVRTATQLFSVVDPHGGRVDFAPNSNLLAIGTATGKKRIELRSALDFKEQFHLEGHTDGPYIFRFTPDGKRLVSVSNSEIIEWDMAEQKQKRRVEHGLSNFDGMIAVLHEARMVVLIGAQGDNKSVIQCWDMAAGKLAWSFQAHSRATEPDHHIANALAASPDGLTFATAGIDGIIRIWDPAKKEEIRAIHKDAEYAGTGCLAYSPDGKIIATPHAGDWGEYGKIVFWDVKTGKMLTARKTRHRTPGFLQFLPDGKQLLVGMGGIRGYVELWDLKDVLPEL